METILELWEGYKLKVLPPNAPEIQVSECRRAFYTGIVSMLTLVVALSNELSEEDACEALASLELECEEYFDNLN